MFHVADFLAISSSIKLLAGIELWMSSSSSVMAGEESKERRILVAVDDNEESMYALSWCLANFISENPNSISRDTIILLYAKPRPGVYTAMDGTGMYRYFRVNRLGPQLLS